MPELVRFGRSTVDVSKIVAFREEDDQVVSIFFDGASVYSLAGTEAVRFLRFIHPRTIDPEAPGPIVSGEAEGSPIITRPQSVRKQSP